MLLDNHLTAKITDFGLSKVKTETMSTSCFASTTKGILRWLAPELVSHKEMHHSEKTDIYSYGMVLWELKIRKAPYQL